MLENSTKIERGVMRHYTPSPLLKTLQAFHQQGAAKKENLQQLFQRLNDHATVRSNIHTPVYDRDSLKIFVQTLKPDTIILVSQEVQGRGKNPRFKNYNGLEGMIQEKCILTSKGIVYESENRYGRSDLRRRKNSPRLSSIPLTRLLLYCSVLS